MFLFRTSETRLKPVDQLEQAAFFVNFPARRLQRILAGIEVPFGLRPGCTALRVVGAWGRALRWGTPPPGVLQKEAGSY